MKNHVIILLEAVRLARLELACYRDPDCAASADWTVERMSELLENRDVNDAMAALVPGEDSPALVPQQPSGEPVNLKVPYPWRSH